MKMSCLPEGVNWNNKEFTKEMLDYMRAVYCMHPMVLDALDYIDSIESRIVELEAENDELKERVAMLDVNSVYKSLGEMGYIEQVDRLTARIAELEQYLSNKETEYTDLWDDALAFQARIAELENKQRWVPVSERLPEESGWYRVGAINVYYEGYTDEVYFDADKNKLGWQSTVRDKVYCWLDGVPELPQLPEVQE